MHARSTKEPQVVRRVLLVLDVDGRGPVRVLPRHHQLPVQRFHRRVSWGHTTDTLTYPHGTCVPELDFLCLQLRRHGRPVCLDSFDAVPGQPKEPLNVLDHQPGTVSLAC